MGKKLDNRGRAALDPYVQNPDSPETRQFLQSQTFTELQIKYLRTKNFDVTELRQDCKRPADNEIGTPYKRAKFTEADIEALTTDKDPAAFEALSKQLKAAGIDDGAEALAYWRYKRRSATGQPQKVRKNKVCSFMKSKRHAREDKASHMDFVLNSSLDALYAWESNHAGADAQQPRPTDASAPKPCPSMVDAGVTNASEESSHLVVEAKSHDALEDESSHSEVEAESLNALENQSSHSLVEATSHDALKKVPSYVVEDVDALFELSDDVFDLAIAAADALEVEMHTQPINLVRKVTSDEDFAVSLDRYERQLQGFSKTLENLRSRSPIEEAAQLVHHLLEYMYNQALAEPDQRYKIAKPLEVKLPYTRLLAVSIVSLSPPRLHSLFNDMVHWEPLTPWVTDDTIDSAAKLVSEDPKLDSRVFYDDLAGEFFVTDIALPSHDARINALRMNMSELRAALVFGEPVAPEKWPLGRANMHHKVVCFRFQEIVSQHWVFVKVYECLGRATIDVYDSLSTSEAETAARRERIREMIVIFCSAAAYRPNWALSDFDFGKCWFSYHQDIQQSNSDDCGVFVMAMIQNTLVPGSHDMKSAQKFPGDAKRMEFLAQIARAPGMPPAPIAAKQETLAHETVIYESSPEPVASPAALKPPLKSKAKPKTGKASGPGPKTKPKPTYVPKGPKGMRCARCTKQKIRCDYMVPCIKCSNAGVTCIPGVNNIAPVTPPATTPKPKVVDDFDEANRPTDPIELGLARARIFQALLMCRPRIWAALVVEVALSIEESSAKAHLVGQLFHRAGKNWSEMSSHARSYLNRATDQIMSIPGEPAQWALNGIPSRPLSATPAHVAALLPVHKQDDIERRYDLILAIRRDSKPLENHDAVKTRVAAAANLYKMWVHWFFSGKRKELPIRLPEKEEDFQEESNPFSGARYLDYCMAHRSSKQPLFKEFGTTQDHVVIAALNYLSQLSAQGNNSPNHRPRVLILIAGLDGGSTGLDSYSEIAQYWRHNVDFDLTICLGENAITTVPTTVRGEKQWIHTSLNTLCYFNLFYQNDEEVLATAAQPYGTSLIWQVAREMAKINLYKLKCSHVTLTEAAKEYAREGLELVPPGARLLAAQLPRMPMATRACCTIGCPSTWGTHRGPGNEQFLCDSCYDTIE